LARYTHWKRKSHLVGGCFHSFKDYLADPANVLSILWSTRIVTPSPSSDSGYWVKTSEVAPYRRVLAGIGTAGATTPATKLTVCKAGVGSSKSRFSINGGVSFAVGAFSCMSKTVPPGENLVTELVDPTGATDLWWIAVRPMSANVVHKVKNSKSQAGYAKVNVASGADVTVGFVDQTVPGVEVCEVAGSPLVEGQVFSFTMEAGGRVVGPFNLQAEPVAALDCSARTNYPVGTMVGIAQQPYPEVVVESVSGADWDGGSDAVATVSHGTTVVTYTNSTEPPPANP
jgi:hypothetical protein